MKCPVCERDGYEPNPYQVRDKQERLTKIKQVAKVLSGKKRAVVIQGIVMFLRASAPPELQIKDRQIHNILLKEGLQVYTAKAVKR